ncbi:sigma E protease regulator RseP [Amphritea sp. 1_MG-2023]|uniref:sigma E protease regulator RseP n=1 Tax=Amphritea sp. 1_MG-2023 TaxID=3062670 RepID=UPI0026E467D2|nr:sigma E protease regulator RseP [Amphritea sp. 1_MG-2023]MDO6562609.1 sigma E protease regulator RseP [Amphritea sp. 1_MG-2023]
MDILNTVVALIVTLGILVTIHEYGHFWVARRCGVKVLRFSVGFGKPLVRWRDRRDTEYVIAMIPLGGYVSMLDEREGRVEPELLDQAFNRKPVLQRIAIVAAGPIVNLIFAVLVYWAMFVSGVEKVVPVIGSVVPQSIAEQAGLSAGVEIVSVAGRATQSWDDVNMALVTYLGESAVVPLTVRQGLTGAPREYRLDLSGWDFDPETQSPLAALGVKPFRPVYPAEIGQLVSEGAASKAGLLVGDKVTSIDAAPVSEWLQLVTIVRQHPGQTLQLGVERNGQLLSLKITPDEKQDQQGVIGYIGAGVAAVEWPPEMLRQVRYGVLDSVTHAASKTWQMMSLTLDSIWKMLKGILSVKNLSGPITIAKVAGASAASGVEAFAGFLAYLSISLGILNLLPIPMLDGGHLLYYAVELLRGRPVSEKVQMIGLRLGMAILFSLMGVAIFNDLMRL